MPDSPLTPSKRLLDRIEPVPSHVTRNLTSEKEKESSLDQYRKYQRLKDHHEKKVPKSFIPSAERPQTSHSYQSTVQHKKPKAVQKLKVPKSLHVFMEKSRLNNGTTARAGGNSQKVMTARNVTSASIRQRSRNVPPRTANAGVDPLRGIGRSVHSKNPPHQTKKRPFTAPINSATAANSNTTPSERIASNLTPQSVNLSPRKIGTPGASLMRQVIEQNSFVNMSKDELHPSARNWSRNLTLSREFTPKEKDRIASGKNIEPAKEKFFPLELFDDEECESRTPQEWLALGQNHGGTRARSRYFNLKNEEYEWRACVVRDYDADKQLYLIEWVNKPNQSALKTSVPTSKMVKRLNLLFDEENEERFFERLRFAQARRAQAERRVRYILQTEKIPEEDVTPIDDHLMDRVLTLVASQFPEEHLELLKTGIEEFRDSYTRAVKKGILDYIRKDPEVAKKLEPLMLQEEEVPPEVPYLATVEVPSFDFSQNQNQLAAESFMTRAVLSDTINGCRSHENIISDKMLLSTVLEHPCSLRDFLNFQKRTLDDFEGVLAKEWMPRIIQVIQLNITEDIYDFYKVDEFEKYDSSRMKRVVRLINLLLSTQLRNVVVKNLTRFLEFIYNFEVNDEEFDILSVNGKTPLFEIFIVADEEQQECKFEPSLDELHNGIKQVIDNMFEETNRVETITSRLYPLLNLDDEYFSSLRPEEEFSQSAWQEIVQVMEDNRDHPLRLLAVYKEFDNVLSFDENYFKIFREDNTVHPTPAEVAATKSKSVVEQDAEKAEDEGEDGSESENEDSSSNSDSEEEAVAVSTPKMAVRAPSQQRKKEEPVEIPLDPNIPGSPSLQKYELELARLQKLIERIHTRSLKEVDFDMVRIQTEGIQRTLVKHCHIASDSIMKYISELTRDANEALSAEYQKIYDRLREQPQNAEELQELRVYMSQAKEQLKELFAKFRESQKSVHVLGQYEYDIPADQFKLYIETFAWPRKLSAVLSEVESKIELDTVKFQDVLSQDLAELNDQLQEFSEELKDFSKFSDIDKVELYYQRVENMNKKLADAETRAKLYNSRERMFKWNTSDFNLLQEIQTNFEEWNLLWTIAFKQSQQYPEWMEGQFKELNPEQVEENTLDWIKHLQKLERSILDEGPRLVAASIRDKLSDFKKYIPLIKALRNKGLRERHWKKISTLIQQEVALTEALKLQDLIDMKTEDSLMEIQEISDYASKEYSIELNLEKMQGEWKKVAFELEQYSGSFKIVEVDEIQMLLDEQIVLTQSMRASPYVKEVENDVIAWEKKLLDMQDILDEWLKCQVGWTYLEPIFSSDDIATQLPKEKTKFNIVDSTWRRIMEKTGKNSIVTQVMTIANLFNDFKKSNIRLDEIQKSLKDYLETKRRAFPRLYFLSDDELLQILSETKDPLRVQPHLKKCFDGIDRLHFTDDLVITAMMGRDGERIDFTRTVSPAEFSGQVELWLFEVQKVMIESVRHVIQESMKAYVNMDRTDWIASHPGQVAIGVGQLFWTKEVEESMMNLGVRGVQKYLKKLEKQIGAIVQRVRGELTPRQRTVFSAVTTIDVHSKDVVANLVKEEVDDVDHFEWKSQLRYYWEDDDLQVKQVTAVRKYGYEYLGNSGRLVITPLTDRCYRTLMGALQLCLGGAPEGPAGTGKTETVKDLAKAVAVNCVVFNCSDSLDTVAMEKFFKGLASSGAWSCFDEFNRIELEVLSVVAQQILQIQLAVKARKESFFFEGTEIDLNIGCAVFITMNPGYAGRSELPDNLKALFRPVAMMVPDYALIAEIVLFSYGFLEGRDLARKIVATYRLCSEQLSSQSHYDYGMRAVMAVLVRAGSLKRQQPDERESLLMLRAITDVNLPKFLSQDIPLFDGIIKDLFPGVIMEESDYSELLRCIHKMCKQRKLQPKQEFLEKIIQLYEMVVVRHGLMLVGQPFAGKTEAYRVLSGALTLMSEKGLEDRTEVCIISPKSITMGQLYGLADPQTGEWKDGTLAIHFRRLSAMSAEMRRWLLFDGPVDALWIESMNTVLDDNRKLCLPSGEIIKMGDNMNMMFEVADLAVASPATVSRCGMVYMEPEKMTWKPLFKSYMQFTIPKLLREDEQIMSVITHLTNWLVEPLLDFVERECKEYNPTSVITRFRSFIDLFDSLLDEFKDKKKSKDIKPKEKLAYVEGLFVFALIWGLGGTVDHSGRKKFNAYFREVIQQETSIVEDEKKGKAKSFKFSEPFPEKDTVYDFFFEKSRKKWTNWALQVQKPQIADDSLFAEIIVPTIDTVRYTYLLDHLIRNDKKVLFVGPTGTGKSAYIKGYMFNEADKKYRPAFVNYSATTSANDSQDIIESKLNKRKKGTIGAPVGKKIILFVDDLNLPTLEEYGAQPPVELLRQFLDHGGWYDRNSKTGDFINIADMLMVCAMGPPGGGRNPVTPRFTRHFNTVSLTPFDDETLSTIFTEIVDWWIKGTSQMSTAKNVVTSSIELYRTVIKKFRPRPDKSHYTFNLRDLSKVFQGVLQMKADMIDNTKTFLRLWTHESMRVFRDRLVNDQDRDLFDETINELLKSKFKSSLKDVVPDGHLLFANYMDQNEDFRKYEELETLDKATKRLSQYLEEYNSNPKKAMDLILFKFAVEHCSRISRVITQPYGNALLIGVGGSGRQSLTKLATYAAGYDLFQITLTKKYDIKDWKDDMKSLLTLAGQKGKSTVFLFTDSQIKNQTFIEDINNLLNTGEIPNLFSSDEKKEICEALRKPAREMGKDQSATGLFNFFVERSRKHLHIVVCMSPVGESLRTYLRMFPSLVSCCTIDWFSEWPREALRSVGLSAIEQLDLDSEDLVESCVDAVVQFHKDVEVLSKQYVEEMRRFNYVTPTSYLELLNMLKELFHKKRTELNNLQHKYGNGIKSILETEKEVEKMQKELEILKPKLVTLSKENEQLTKTITREAEQVAETRVVVEAEEKRISQQNEENEKVKQECEAQLAKALPALKKANKALSALQKSHITEVKSMKSPPTGVKLVMKTVCIIKGKKPIKVDLGMGKKEDDWWEPAKKMMGERGFLESLVNYNIEDMNDAIVDKLKPITTQKDYNEKSIMKSNVAAAGLCAWVLSLVEVHEIMKVVRPRQEALKKAQEEAAKSAKELKETKAKMQELQDKLDKLEAERQQCMEKKEALEKEYADVTAKLERAQKLVGLLAGEKDRWTQTSELLALRKEGLTGDVLLSSAFMSYLGAFTAHYRAIVLKKWFAFLREKNVKFSDNFTLASSSGKPEAIREWLVQGLPSDDFSIENAVITANARRWPLFIDPQGQAMNWIRNMEASSENGLMMIKASDPNLVRSLEKGIQMGSTVILEKVGEDLDPALEPLLLKQIFKVGGMLSIAIGDNPVTYNENFKLYMITNLSNPHYLPEVQTKVTLLNFMITPKGLDDQLLGLVVRAEREDLEKKKEELAVESVKNQNQLSKIEDEILTMLAETEDILADDTAVNMLSNSKKTADNIKQQQQQAERILVDIDANRDKYKPVARSASILFFVVSEMNNVDPMYQFSLQWFNELFLTCIGQTSTSGDRITNLIDFFKYALYQMVCRSFFEKDKLLFSFLMCIAIMKDAGNIDSEEWRFLLTGGVPVDASQYKNPTSWLTDASWSEIVNMTRLESMKDFLEDFSTNHEQWKYIYDSPAPENEPLPGKWNSYTDLQKLIILRTIRLDCLPEAVEKFIVSNMDKRFVSPPRFDIATSYSYASCERPLIFILSAGVDPMATLQVFAEKELGEGAQLDTLSLGQGQGKYAAEKISKAVVRGNWVVLQNCHLCPSWMPDLEKIVDTFQKNKTADTFRLWLTSMPSPDFPASVLQKGVKMTNEPPKGLRANLLSSWNSDPITDDEFFEGCDKPREFKKLLFGLCFFHGIVQERRKFGPIGWNIRYEFNESDLNISTRQLRYFLDQHAYIPFKTLTYLTGECNYGGRVTDDHDRRTLNAILSDFYTEEILNEGYALDPEGKYFVPPEGPHEAYSKYIETLPVNPPPSIFGLHDNANISKNQLESLELFNSALSTQQTSGGGSGSTMEEVVDEQARDILEKLPPVFDIEEIQQKYPVLYEESMNTVLVQELIRYNRLIKVIQSTLVEVRKALSGEVVMSADLEKVATAIFNGKIPQAWQAKSYPSLKPLGGYVADLLKRIEFFQNWVDEGPPVVFWLSGLFFTQSFLTGTKQNFARKYVIAIDTIEWEFEILKERPTTKPKDGAYVEGLFLEGACWDSVNHQLTEPKPKKLFDEMPIIWLKPVKVEDQLDYPHYVCPLYKTTARHGTLSTTGHSTNFVMEIKIPSDKPQKVWVKGGVALFCSS
eukprot:CAMPEP_0117446884 /NCGR_PEP_ID=MMETSP0759-20121206/6580_1 /TAXON_ID=63605 /ORGANISM="Percolomonas cosmopolitus, Strain WS" /LENGTH=4305 /DNA_ID=CAMNT_0005239183 /DNA_START=148 /DNA_END=13065 /DNA_ORIENTATION=-